MAWAKVATNTYHSSSTSSIALTKPTGTTEDDIMFVLFSCYLYNSQPSSTPSGWTKLAEETAVNLLGYTAVYYKVAGSSEPSSYTWSFGDTRKRGAVIITYRDGFDTSDPIDTHSNVEYKTNNTNLRGAGITVSSNNSPIIHIGDVYNTTTLTFTPPSGYNEDLDTGSTTSDLWFSVSSDTVSSGATGDQDATISGSEASKHAFLIALNPPPADPVITDCEDEDISESETGVIMDGTDLTGGTPSLEIGNNAVYGSCTVKSTQTINSNSGTQVDFDVVLGSLSYGTNWLYHTTGVGTSSGYSINLYADNTISSADSAVYHGEGATITGGKFGTSQGSSRVLLCDSADASGTNVVQTVDSWGDTSITITVDKGSFSYGTTLYLVVGRNNSGRGDSLERLSNGYSTTLTQVTRISYRQIMENGGGTVAYLWHVGGYPWAVTDSQALIDALEDTDDSTVQAARKRLFGNNEWTDGATTVTPAYSVPIFPTLIRDFGNVKYESDPSNGFLKGGRWNVKIEDRHLGHKWEHAASGDAIWSIEGLQRTARVKESSVHGWGYLEENLLRVVGGVEPGDVEFYEQSNQKIFDRIAALSEGEFLHLWLNYECIAVNAKTGTFPKYDLEFCDVSGTNLGGRGLYHSRKQNHFSNAIAGLDPIIADVPGSIVGKYCKLYSIPMNDGALMLTSEDEPMIVEELRGVISPNVETANSVTKISINPDLDALKRTHNIEVSRNLETHLAGFMFSRGDSGVTETSVIENWQQPHLVIWEYDGGPDGTFLFDPPYYNNQTYWDERYIWLCPKNSTVRFDTTQQVIDALNTELEKLCSGDPTAHSWPDDGVTGTPVLSQNYRVMKLKDNEGGIIRYYMYSWIEEDEVVKFTGFTDEFFGAPKYMPISITGPLAWVFALGEPSTQDENLYTMIRRYPDRYLRLELVNEWTNHIGGNDDWESLEPHWMIVNSYISSDPMGLLSAINIALKSTKSSFGSMIPEYYYGWDWENNAPSTRASAEISPNNYETWSLPTTPEDNDDRLFLPENTDPNSITAGDTIFFGLQKGRFPQLSGTVSEVDDDLDFSDLVSLKISTDGLGVIGSETFPLGTSLFYLQNGELWGLDYDDDKHVDPHYVSKILSIDDSVLSDVFKSLLGASALSGINISKEVTNTDVPFFLDEDNFTSAINWDQLDEAGKIFGQVYEFDPDNRTSIYNIVKNELLVHRVVMTRYFDDSELMWRYGFNRVGDVNVSTATNSGYLLDGAKCKPGAPIAGHGNNDLYNRIKYVVGDHEIFFEAQNASIVGPDSVRTLTIKPNVTKFVHQASIIYAQMAFAEFLEHISYPSKVNTKDTTLYQYLFPVGKEIMVDDESGRMPYTHAPNIDNMAAMVVGYQWNYKKNEGKISYRFGGPNESHSLGFAPACYLESGNFSKDAGSWEGTPNDHEFTSSDQPKDVYFFDCYNFADPTNPTARTSCGCSDYAVYAIEMGAHNWTPLSFTCSVATNGTITLTGTTTNIDTSKDYVIVYQGYDSCENCQQSWIFHADDNNTIGSSSLPARRFV